MLFKAILGLFTLLILQLGAITGLVRRPVRTAWQRLEHTPLGCAACTLLICLSAQVFTVVKAMQQTSVSADNPVMTVKGSSTAVQTANSEFFIDPASGSMMLRSASAADTPPASSQFGSLVAPPQQPQLIQTSTFSMNTSVRLRVVPSPLVSLQLQY